MEFLGGDDCVTETLDPLACTRPSSDEFVTIFESFYPKYQGFQLFLFDFSLQFPFVSYDASQFFCDCIKPEMDKGSKNLILICIIASIISCPCFFSLCWKNTSDIRTNSL